MGKFFDNQLISNVAAANDIVDVISSYVQLKKDGKNYSALCPFHREKTPSFKVFPDSQRYKCFGCGKGGNVFGFVQDIEKLTFPETVEFLARRASVPLAQSSGEKSRVSDRNSIFELNNLAADFFSHNLLQDCGNIAREYLESRGFDKEFSTFHRLGYSMGSWTGLVDFMGSKGIKPEKLVEAGLALKSDNGKIYDRFRNRLMFPIHDARGKIAGFGARALGDDHPKYLNTSETPAFNKSGLLYGLFNARKAIERAKYAIVMEGYTDVLAAVQCGFENTCATLGTALTAQHLKLLKRYTERVTLVYDGDEAGIKAAERSLPIFVAEEMPVDVAILPEGSDPFDFLRNKGKGEFKKFLRGAKSLFSFYMNSIVRRFDLSDPTQKAKAAELLAGMTAKVPDKLHREVWITEIAQFLSIRQDTLLQKVNTKCGVASLRNRQRGEENETNDGNAPVILRSALWNIIGALLQHPVLLDEYSHQIKERVKKEEIPCRLLLQMVSLHEEKDLEWQKVYWQTIVDEVSYKKSERALETAPEDIERAREVIEKTLSLVDIPDTKSRINELRRMILEAEQEGDEWALTDLLVELQNLLKSSPKKRS